MTHAGGRPTEYTPEILTKAREYLDTFQWETRDERTHKLLKVSIPTKGGLAYYLDVSRETVYDWSNKYPEFSYIMERCGSLQEMRLIQNGLSGEYNSTIAKVLLTKHGYRDSIEATGKDGKDLIPEVSLGALELAQQLNDLDKQRRIKQVSGSNGADTESVGTEA